MSADNMVREIDMSPLIRAFIVDLQATMVISPRNAYEAVKAISRNRAFLSVIQVQQLQDIESLLWRAVMLNPRYLTSRTLTCPVPK